MHSKDEIFILPNAQRGPGAQYRLILYPRNALGRPRRVPQQRFSVVSRETRKPTHPLKPMSCTAHYSQGVTSYHDILMRAFT